MRDNDVEVSSCCSYATSWPWPPRLPLLLLLLGLSAFLPPPPAARGETRSPRVVATKYGKLRGSIRPLPNKHLRPVEVFLGVPYATPPTGSNRFSPTRTPSPWAGEKEADQYGPVCPQHLPELWDDDEAEASMPRSRLMHLRRLANYLTHQAEDCLYLNVYVPSLVADTRGHRALPVVVYIHGESYLWGASNPYDGSVLAAHGEVIVVTLNYRLGPLGFLNTNADPTGRGHVMNHGLIDQIAALHWVQENIGAFGGDPGSVTLLGHGTGAACIHFLMASTAVAPGLFHRTILMSGSALSPWAVVGTPIHYALQFGRALNCTSSGGGGGGGGGLLPQTAPPEFKPSNEELDLMVNCLKEKPLEELQTVHVPSPQFLYAFGPSVDGIVIRNDYRREIRKRADEQTKEYDLLFGVVPHEAYDLLSNGAVENGVDAEGRDRIFRTMVRNSYDYHLNEVFISVVNEYTDWENPDASPAALRDATLAALGDSQYVAPLLKTANNLRIGDKNQFFYVFDHTSSSSSSSAESEFSDSVKGAVHGDELAYVFGAPLVGELGVFTANNWTHQDTLVSETLLYYIANFAKTGNPNLRPGQELTANARDKSKFKKLVWEKYDPVYQKYLYIGSRPRMRDHYRAHQLALWTWLVPQLQRVGRLEFLTLRDPDNSHLDDEERLQELSVLHHLFAHFDSPELYSGSVRPLQHMAGHYVLPPTTTTAAPTTPIPTTTLLPPQLSQMFTTPRVPRRGSNPLLDPYPDVLSNATAHAEATKPQGVGYMAYSTALSVTIAIGVSLLILNLLIFAGVYYQRDRSRAMGSKQEQQSQLHSQGGGGGGGGLLGDQQQMAAISSATGPTLGSSINLEVMKLPMPVTTSSVKAPPPSPLTHTHPFAHISECPPAFADTPLTLETGSHCVTIPPPPPTIPNGSATMIDGGGQHQHQQQLKRQHQHQQQQEQIMMPRPPPPPRLSESQPLLPAQVPAPPRGKIPPFEELQV
ncbi:neuroligin-4, X-linked-like isoform X1 [Macrobrachium rosenbergii]|uniref:neuroligin-4, X-linked-like isoform X1 n=1 Tax=Macrobrachium rosenbergii TaxID=79674 RepID=UPI0034D78A69